ncbi:MAG: hypothetical protein SPD11_10565 [Sphaerochaetaceae bacterium]|nr:hypothetical protein [Sphaerochaetaceae bacterium]
MDDKTRQFNGNQQDGQRRKKNQDQKKRHKQRNGRPQDQQQVSKSIEPAFSLQRKPSPPRRSTLPSVYVPHLQEPLPVCAICGRPIENIASAVSGPQPETYSHFDCVLEKITADEHVQAPCKVSYIGRGTFAVIEMQKDGSFVIQKRIVYESAETFSAMKRFVEENKK